MDAFCSQITTLITNGSASTKTSESLHRRQIDLSDCDLRAPDPDEIGKAFRALPERDAATLTIRPNAAAPVVISSTSDIASINGAMENLADILQIADSHSGELSLMIEKSVRDQTISVYSLGDLADNWADMNPIDLLQGFSAALNEETLTRFCLLDNDCQFATRTTEFSPNGKHASPTDSNCARSALISSQLSVCNFSNGSSIRLIPDDFYISSGYPPTRIRELFNKLCVSLTLIFLCDTSSLRHPGTLSISLRGYTLIQKDVEISTFTNNNWSELFRVYEWCYSDGCLSDRVGLARNVLSLHTGEQTFPDFKEGVLGSIHSSFEIYLKENIDQYLDIKAKLDEHLTSLAHEVASVSKDIAGSFKTNVWMLVSFLASVIVLKVIRGSGDAPLITGETLVVFGVFAAFSLAYLLVVHIDSVGDVDRLNTRYLNIKRRYSDILSPIDIDRIFNEDTDIESEKHHIRKTKRRYFSLWISFLTVFTTSVLTLWLNTPPSQTAAPKPSAASSSGATDSQEDNESQSPPRNNRGNK